MERVGSATSPAVPIKVVRTAVPVFAAFMPHAAGSSAGL